MHQKLVAHSLATNHVFPSGIGGVVFLSLLILSVINFILDVILHMKHVKKVGENNIIL